MRSILAQLGPYEWPAVIVIAAIVFAVVLLWRALAEALGDELGPIDGRWFAFTIPAVGAVSVGIFLAVNHFAPVEIKSYGVMLLCGYVAGIIYTTRVGPRLGFPATAAIDVALATLFAAIIGARVLFVILLWDEYSKSPTTVLEIMQGGLSFHGGLIGALLAAVLFCRWGRYRFAVVTDILTPAVPIGYALTRLGCFLNGCCHGHETSLPWGVVFPQNVRHFPDPVHPTQLYASAGSLLLFAILIRLWPRLQRPGQLFPSYMFLYAILRFLCEYTRRGATAKVSAIFPAFTIGQLACIGMAIVGIVWFLILQRKPYENPLEAQARLPEPAPSEPKTQASGKSGEKKASGRKRR